MFSQEGYQEAAEHFRSEANVEPEENSSMLHERMKVREAIQSGEIENAVQLIDSHFPGVLTSNDELRFQLQVTLRQNQLFALILSVFWMFCVVKVIFVFHFYLYLLSAIFIIVV